MNTFKLVVPLVILAIVFMVGFWLAQAEVPEVRRSPVPPISLVQEMSDLATLRVHLHDYMRGENMYWKVCWMLHGEAVLGVDLSQAAYTSVDKKNCKAALLLPSPHVICSKVDHYRSAEMTAKQKTWIPSPGLKSLRDEVWQHADAKVACLAQHDGYLEATELQAERVLNGLFRDAGWNISYEWQPISSPSGEGAGTQ